MSVLAVEVEHVVWRLVETYKDQYPESAIESAVLTAHQRLDSARVRTFVPILTERYAREIIEQSPPQV
jgi:hypothetical protein